MILIKLLFWLVLLYGISGLVVYFLKIKKDSRSAELRSLPYWKISIIAGLIGVLITSTIVKIDAQEVGVVIKPSGVSPDELKTGWHVLMPWNDLFTMDKTVQVYSFTQSAKEGNKAYEDAIWTPTSEGIKLGYDLSVNWRIDPDNASWIFANVAGEDDNLKYQWIEENIIRASTKMVLSSIVKDYRVIDAYTQKRDSIQVRLNRELGKILKEKSILLDEAGIREVHYNVEYEKAINNKKLAEQEALRLADVTKQKEELLKQASIEKDIVIQQAEGEAKALQIKGSSISSNPKIIELQWIDKWDGQLPTYMMGSGQGIMLNLNK